MTEPDPRAPADAPPPGEGRVRALPSWARIGSVLVRAGHLIGCAVIVGAHVLGSASRAGAGWWALTAISGVLLIAYEWAGHLDHWRQLSGWATLLKLLLLAIAAAVPAAAVTLLLTAMVVSVLGARLPRGWRHRLLW